MEPIISPWIIYFIGMVDTLIGVFIAVATISGCVALVGIVGTILLRFDSSFNEKYLPLWRKWVRIGFALFIPFITLVVFTPSRNTIIGMVVAKHITKNNIASIVESGKDFKKELQFDIIEIIDAINPKDKK